jgi:hypothetical protein
MKTTAYNTRPVIRRDWDGDDPGYLDSKRFAEFGCTVKAAIDRLCRKTKRAVTIADIKRELGENLKDAWLMDSLNNLCSLEDIRQTRDITPIRFEPSAPRVKATRGWNTAISTTGHKDSEQIFGGR